MPPSTPALRAHWRLVEEMATRVRTHAAPAPVLRVGQGYKRDAACKARLAERLREMQAEGMTRREMMAALGVSSRTVTELLGRTPLRGLAARAANR